MPGADKEILDKRKELLHNLVESIFTAMKRIKHNTPEQEFSLSPAQARLLFILGKKNSAGVTVKEMAEKASITSGAITQFTDALVEKSFVKREQDPDDRRLVRLVITEAGRAQSKAFHQCFLASVTDNFQALSNDEMSQLIFLLSKVGPTSPCKESVR
ncbi:MAG: MarR family transcriptional regulator [Dehalococcoidales bacterium]|nr:MarR family transcriptional regulator [Dehalococcoidales bacterium]